MTDWRFDEKIVTIERHIQDQQSHFPGASGQLTGLLQDIALAGKMIASRTTRAGLADIIGATGDTNVQGETVQKLDIYAHRTLFRLNDHTGRLCAMGSEEEEHLIPIPQEFEIGDYVLLFDPLDGSSNISYNVSVGTIFTIFRRVTPSGPGTLEDALQPMRRIVAAGYIVYGSSTMMVYSAGNGVDGFTLDPSVGEFLLSHPNIKLPETPRYWSSNVSYYPKWSKGVKAYSDWLMSGADDSYNMSMRYIGSMIADIHRLLLSGGIFFYPPEVGKDEGKLRLLYEVAPMGFLVRQAGGYVSTGIEPVWDIEPTGLHQRISVFMGNRDLVEKAEAMIAEIDGAAADAS